MTSKPPPSPYKFLASYEYEDRDLFFGRERETQILLSEVLVGRMVVLFAKTGTGKTSLINAGVRPLLQERGYETFFVRVRQDPVVSVRDALREQKIRLPRGRSLAARLLLLVEQRQKPIVLFFDQFEEFFLYLMKNDSKAARAFITDLAALYHHPDSSVHVVLSMREEFFVDLNAFREEIPTIFHNDSNLQLGWFGEQQARAAIVKPAAARGVEVEQALADRLIADLTSEDNGLIEPAQLQIVCDSLWQEQADGRMTLARYRALGEPRDGLNIAGQILNRRLQREFGRIQSREELQLLEKLLPALRTERRTKYVRDIDGLVRELDAPPERLAAVLAALEDPGLVVRLTRDDLQFVELTHDYLVERLDDLRAAVSVIWPRRVLHEAMKHHRRRRRFPAQTEDLEEVLQRVVAAWEAELAGAAGQDPLQPDRAEARFLLMFALHRGTHMESMFAAASEVGVAVWDLLREQLHGDDVLAASNTVDLLPKLLSPQALPLLEEAWQEEEEIAAQAVEVLAGLPTDAAVGLLERAVAQENLAPYARQALITLARFKRDPNVSERAGTALVRHLDRLGEAGTLGPSEVHDLGMVEQPSAVEFLERLLADATLAQSAKGALLMLGLTPTEPVRGLARTALDEHLAEEQRAGRLSGQDVRILARMGGTVAVDTLERVATEEGELAAEAEHALTELVRSSDPRVSERARRALVGIARPAAPERLPEPELASAPGGLGAEAAWSAPPTTLSESHFRLMVRLLLDGRLALFLGVGMSLANRPQDEVWRPGGGWMPSGRELSRYLAARFEFPSHGSDDLIRVAEYVRVTVGIEPLYDVVREVLVAPAEPTASHRLVAELPGILRANGGPKAMFIVSAALDDLLERALVERDESFNVVSYIAREPDVGSYRFYPPGGWGGSVLREKEDLTEFDAGLRTVILKLFGGVDQRNPSNDSYVLSEEDHLWHLVHTVDPGATGMPPALRSRWNKSSFLFLGYGLRDWSVRVLLSPSTGLRVASKSWAVMLGTDPLQQGSLRGYDIEVVDMPLEEYLERLRGHVEELG
jgi:hypothetical protein